MHVPRNLKTLSEYNRAVVLGDMDFIKQHFFPTEIWLMGSYARGIEINGATPDHIKSDLMAFRNKSTESDRDYYIEPPVSDIYFSTDPHINILPTKPNYAFQVF